MLTSAKIGKQNGDTRTRKPESGYLNFSILVFVSTDNTYLDLDKSGDHKKPHSITVY
jgi:hypothetical protein